ncbi:hypothetical protein C8J57DRAFT_1580180 [Mycena rebaudengoi]|nr:hypothetical protein C8J57DRAFT_1580180 [Mycena rebaudengoi]
MTPIPHDVGWSRRPHPESPSVYNHHHALHYFALLHTWLTDDVHRAPVAIACPTLHLDNTTNPPLEPGPKIGGALGLLAIGLGHPPLIVALVPLAPLVIDLALAPAPTADKASKKPAAKKDSNKRRGTPKEKNPPKKIRIDDGDANSLQLKGRIVGRTIEMFSGLEFYIEAGLTRDPDDDDELFTAKENEMSDTYMTLLKTIPTLHDLLTKLGGETASKEVARLIDAGRKDARNADISTVRAKIRDWYKFDPPLDANRNNYGFYHKTCGRLMCPVSLAAIWEDPKVKERLRDRLVEVKAQDYPVFLWVDEKSDPLKPFEGFLQHVLLVKGYLCVFFGPEAAKKGTAGGHGSGDAQIHNITAPTFEAIAYVAVLIHFALSSQTTFDAGGSPGKWPYRTFYRELLRTINNMPTKRREQLLAWWTEKMHGLPEDGEAAVSKLDPAKPAPTMAQIMLEYAKNHPDEGEEEEEEEEPQQEK